MRVQTLPNPLTCDGLFLSALSQLCALKAFGFSVSPCLSPINSSHRLFNPAKPEAKPYQLEESRAGRL